MKLSLFDYNLPKELIAQEPAKPRDNSRLLVYNQKSDKIIHDKFLNLPKYLTPNDVLVFNDTKVFPARLLGQKESGGKAELLLLKKLEKGVWEALIGARKPKIGLKLRFDRGLTAKVVDSASDKTWAVKFNFSGPKFQAVLNQIGQTPLPPYINTKASTPSRASTNKPLNQHQKDQQTQHYQTIYAKHLGSAAAPTAGFHFSKRLLNKIKARGCQIEFVTLHVGLGTFNPVDTDNIEDYKIHKERVSVKKNVIKKLLKAKAEGKRIIAVGTTSVRTLEAVFAGSPMAHTMGLQKNKSTFILHSMKVRGFNDWVDIFIYPGYKFNLIDAMITNFHLPKSSLLMLVSAFIGRKKTLEIYKKAIKLKYRFFSFGDGMLLQNEK